MSQKIKLQTAIIIGLILSGCAYDPLIISSEYKTPLVDAPVRSVHAGKIIQHPPSSNKITRKSSASAESIASLKRKLAMLDLELELVKAEIEHIKQKAAFRERWLVTKNKSHVPVPSLSRYWYQVKKDVFEKKKDIDEHLEFLQDQSQRSKSTVDTSSNSSKDVFFYTVYVSQERQEWISLWDRLQQVHVQDKWRGYAHNNKVYFIYVGAYVRPHDAKRRQENLLRRLGRAPIIVTGSRRDHLAFLLEYSKRG